jgi:hypothetical protein
MGFAANFKHGIEEFCGDRRRTSRQQRRDYSRGEPIEKIGLHIDHEANAARARVDVILGHQN